jgi:hypothetical protein
LDALTALRHRYPIPAIRPKREPFYWCLDGGGKQLIKDAIREHDVKLMIEVGVFFGGSAIQWMETKSDLTVIGIDHWKTNWSEYFDRNFDIYKKSIRFGGLSRDSMRQQLDDDKAALECTISNLWDYRDRFIPIQGSSPGKLYDLHELGVKPDLFYVDGNKIGLEIEVCHELFPDCIISGDDWSWNEAEGFPIRKAVYPFAEKYRFDIKSDLQTWILEPRR